MNISPEIEINENRIKEIYDSDSVKLIFHHTEDRYKFLTLLEELEKCSRSIAKTVYMLLCVSSGKYPTACFQVTRSKFIAISKVTMDLKNGLKIVDYQANKTGRINTNNRISFKVVACGQSKHVKF